MGLGLFTAFATPLFYIFGAGRHRQRLRTLGGYALTLALLLMPMATEAAVGLLACDAVRMRASAVRILDGGSAFATGRKSQDVVNVPVLASNPYFLCWAGSHVAAASVAAIAMALYLTGLPVCVFVWLWRDPWLRQQTARLRAAGKVAMRRRRIKGDSGKELTLATARGASRIAPAPATPKSRARSPLDSPSGSAVTMPPASAPGSARELAPQTSEAATAVTLTDADIRVLKWPDVAADPLLNACFEGAGYGPHAWYFRCARPGMRLDVGAASLDDDVGALTSIAGTST